MSDKNNINVGKDYKQYGKVEEVKDKGDCYIVHTEAGSIKVNKK